MQIRAHEQDLPGVLLLEFDAFEDDRGFFYESYSQRKFAELGIDRIFVQDNHSRSRSGVLRGLHFQASSAPQWRLVRCTAGEIFDVAVDIAVGSETFGQWVGVRLSASNRRQLLIPPSFAHGFLVLSDTAEVQYKCTGHHDSSAERALKFDDPDLAIDWPITQPLVMSQKDLSAQSLRDYLANPDFPIGWTADQPEKGPS